MWQKLFLFLLTLFLFALNINSIRAAENQKIYLEFFWSQGCPHCAKEKEFLDELMVKYPQLQINSYEISQNPNNIKLLQQRGRELSADVSGVPFTVIGADFISGFATNETTGREIELLIQQSLNQKEIEGLKSPEASSGAGITISQADMVEQKNKTNDINKGKVESIVIPFIGQINIKYLSLPLLTLIIALADGFNPCAMWTLLFLISLLLGMKNRKRMWILGVTFIITSAFVYFLFLSAWLNLFIFLGLVIWVRLIIAVIALIAGFIYLKDFIENKSGCKVMGDEKRKRIFEKLRDITSKENFLIALGGIILLAFAVNLVELICSAGLPAIYTKILSMYQLPTWQYYLYLVFYIIVFMLDDLFIFFTAMITLHTIGIQSKYSRMSHLIGGILMLIIGIIMLFKPELLMFG